MWLDIVKNNREIIEKDYLKENENGGKVLKNFNILVFPLIWFLS